MRIFYGIGDNNVEVTDKLLTLKKEELENIRDFNLYFGDPKIGAVKYLKVEKDGIYYIPENAKICLQDTKWDWITYVLNYTDLYNIKSECDAIYHYTMFGKKEGRVFYPLWHKKGTFMSYSSGGLVNQMIDLCHSLILCHYTGRDLYYPDFRLEYNKDEFVSINEIINIESLHKTLDKFGLECRLIDRNVDDYKNSSVYNGWDTTTIPKGNIIDFLVKLKSEKYMHINIGHAYIAYEPFSASDQNSYRCIYKLINQLLSEIKFNDIFYSKAKEYMPSQPYSAVHLRCEDDFLIHSFLSGINSEKYGYYLLHNTQLMNNKNIFVSTHLTKSNYRLNKLLDNTNYYLSPKNLNLPWKGREINAIVDYIICQNAKEFLGVKGSSFSVAIAWHRNINCKKYSLVHVYKDNIWISTDLEC